MFKSLEVPLRDRLADFDSPLLAGLAGLLIARERAGREQLSLEELVAVLEAAGVGYQRIAIARAMARAGRRVATKRIGTEIVYTLMTKGRLEVEPLLSRGSVGAVYVDGQQPRTARKELQEVLGVLKGTIKICDPYFGIRTLDTLEKIPASCNVRFLTGKLSESEARLGGPVKDFRRERKNTELRVYAQAGELHDRYILSKDQLLLVGHGLKDIGTRESFVILLERAIVPEMAAQVEASFDQKWAASRPI